jgi:HlyD family secretion protein
MKSTNFFLLLIFSAPFFQHCSHEGPEAFAYGNFESNDIMVSAETTGKLVSFSINEGDKVDQSQILGIVDTAVLALKKEQIMASGKAVSAKLTQLEDQISINKVQWQNIQRELDRVTELKIAGAATDKQFDDLKGQKDLVMAQTKALESQKLSVYAEIEAQNAQLAQINDQLKRSVLKSPIEGTILEKYLEQGELAITGRALYSVTDLSVLTLRVFVDGSQLSAIKTGDRVNVNYDTTEGLSQMDGIVSWVSPRAEFTPKVIQTRDDRVNLVYAVKIRVQNNGILKIGMPGEISLIN